MFKIAERRDPGGRPLLPAFLAKNRGRSGVIYQPKLMPLPAHRALAKEGGLPWWRLKWNS